MPSTLDKTRKRISKKRGGLPNALHEKSRDSLRLHKAGVRDQRLEKLAAARGKKEQPIRKMPLGSLSLYTFMHVVG
jgi:translation machinery-associated protein 16